MLYDGLPEERRALQREVLEQGAFSVCLTHYDLAMRDRAALRKVRVPAAVAGVDKLSTAGDRPPSVDRQTVAVAGTARFSGFPTPCRTTADAVTASFLGTRGNTVERVSTRFRSSFPPYAGLLLLL